MAFGYTLWHRDMDEQNVGPKPPTVRFEMEAVLPGGPVNIVVRPNSRTRFTKDLNWNLHQTLLVAPAN